MRIPITLGDKRIEELDFLKCVFIILMIAFHLIYIGNTYPVAKQLVYTFHMPGFLLVSGYLFNVRKSWSRVGHTLLWILIPYAVMEIGYTVMASLLPIREHIDHLSAGLLLNKIFLHPIGPYWYLHTLILCGASYYICFCVPRLPWQGKAALLAVLLGALSLGCGLLSWANAAYFFVGVLIRQSVVDFRKAFPARWWVIIPLVALCLDNSHYDRASFAGASIVYLVISLLMWLFHFPFYSPLRRLLLFIGRNTLPLLLFSPLFTMLAKSYQAFLLQLDSTGMLFLVISVSLAVAGSFAITWLMDRLHLSPFFFGKDQQLTNF